ncbi:Uncharacterized protein ALO90_05022, partial [Pseudomonas amygdali pv. aesculi]
MQGRRGRQSLRASGSLRLAVQESPQKRSRQPRTDHDGGRSVSGYRTALAARGLSVRPSGAIAGNSYRQLSSGDRPAALAELIGIIQNDGIRLPPVRIDSLHFAAGTPYDTELTINPELGQRVLPAEVAAAMREALSQVVDGGTAKRVQGTFKMQDGSVL